MDRMVEVVRLTRAIAKSEPFVAMIDSEVFPNQTVEDDHLRDQIRTNISTYSHPTSTVPMGRDDDAAAVVDASIIPDIPSVPTNVTTIMIAERIAARLRVRSDHRRATTPHS